MKRKYYGLDLYLEHPFDGKWFGKIDYLYSRSYGNSEGQVRTDIGQTDVSATVDWDYAKVMDYADGALANDRRHQIKAYGSYQIASEWMLSGNLAILSGGPRTCLGYYGVDQPVRDWAMVRTTTIATACRLRRAQHAIHGPITSA